MEHIARRSLISAATTPAIGNQHARALLESDLSVTVPKTLPDQPAIRLLTIVKITRVEIMPRAFTYLEHIRVSVSMVFRGNFVNSL